MNKSAIKSLIKEIIMENLFGKKVTLQVGNAGKLPGIFTKNTRLSAGEEPYRFTWFVKNNGIIEPGGHIHFTKEDMDKILSTGKFSSQQEKQLQKNFLMNVPMRVDFTPPKIVESVGHIHESMNVYVKDTNYDRMDLLPHLANHLLQKIVSPTINKLPDDQKNYFKRNGVGYYDMLVPDGNYYSGTDGNAAKGTLNLYTSGIISASLQNILKGIFEELRKLGVKWGQIKKEKSGVYKNSEVIRIPILSNPSKYSGPPEVNLSNRNAFQIFKEILQFEDDDYTFTMNSQDLKERIESILNHDPEWMDKNTVDTKIDKPEVDPADTWKDEPPKGATMINVGIDKEYIKQRLEQILEIANWAIQHGKKEITVS